VPPAALAAAFLATLLALSRLLKGPAATTDDLRRLRDPYREALAERAFLNAQLALAATDSTNIVLDARSKYLAIVIRGVKLRECRLASVEMDQAIRKLVSGKNEPLWLERPFILTARRGNLPDPWKPVAEGPVDTLKGAKAARELPMDGSLIFDRGLVVHIKTPPSSADSLEMRGIKGLFRGIARRAGDARSELDQIVKGPSKLDIYVRISREDAAAVLRALSVGGGMALRL
jgi:hypothetical protein